MEKDSFLFHSSGSQNTLTPCSPSQFLTVTLFIIVCWKKERGGGRRGRGKEGGKERRRERKMKAGMERGRSEVTNEHMLSSHIGGNFLVE